jgi:23S rRNA pseudouridine1911/1915/1917 synthase
LFTPEPAILFEDDHFAVLNKPRGMHSCKHQEHSGPTVVDFLLDRWPHLVGMPKGQTEAGLINRLDFFTSGILIAAKRDDVRMCLRTMNSNAKIIKHYLAVVEGRAPDCTELDTFIGSPRRRGKRVYVYDSPPAHDRCARAVSTIRATSYLPFCDCSIVEVRLYSGRRHQVRAHCAYLGCPLLGDALYGARRSLMDVPALVEGEGATGFLLHAASIALNHPVYGRPLKLFAPLPQVYAAFELHRAALDRK